MSSMSYINAIHLLLMKVFLYLRKYVSNINIICDLRKITLTMTQHRMTPNNMFSFCVFVSVVGTTVYSSAAAVAIITIDKNRSSVYSHNVSS